MVDFYGLGVEPKLQDDVDLEAPNKTGVISGGYESFKDAFLNSTLHNKFITKEIDFENLFHPGEWLTPQQYEKSEFKRPGKTFPFGVSTSQARISAKESDSQVKRDEIVNNMNSGFIPASSKFIGNILGFASDPTNIVAALLVPEIVGTERAATAAGLTERAFPRLIRSTIEGGVEGGLIMSPPALSEQEKEDAIGGDPSAIALMQSIATGMAFGGAARGLGATYKILSTKGEEAAAEAAIGQSTGDQVPNVTDVVTQGYNEARAADEFKSEPFINPDDLTDEQLTKVRTNLYPEVDTNEGMRDYIKAAQDIDQHPRLPMDLRDIRTLLKNTDQEATESAYDLGRLDNYRQFADNLSGKTFDNADELEKQIDQLRANEELPPEIEKHLSDLDTEEANWNEIGTSMKDYITCILERGDV